MADNTLQTGSDTIATDDLTTLNGGAVTGVKAQRVKVGFGVDGTFSDVASTVPLPTVTYGSYATGTITAANANINNGTATAGSTVQITVPEGHSSWDIFVNGTFSAGTTLYTQGSLDGTNWFSLNGRRNTDASTNDTTNFIAADFIGGPSPTGSNPSNYRGNLGAVRFFRVTCFAYAAADSIAVQIASSAGVGATFLNNVPQFKLVDGAATANNVSVKAASTAAVAADNGLVVTIHPSSAPTTTQPVSGTFFQATQPVSGTFFQTTQPVSIATMPSTPVTGTFFQATQPVSIAASVAVTGAFFQATQPVSLATNTPTLQAGTAIAGKFGIDQTTPGTTNLVSTQSSPLCVSGIGTANTAFTTTLAAPAAGQFHYITGIEIIRVNATVTAVAAAASLISITTTNLPGSLGWAFGNAIGAGAYDVPVRVMYPSPIKASAAATATTVVCPAGGAGVQFRVNVYYYTV